MAEFICNAGPNLEIWRVSPDEIREQDINARAMPPEMLERLISNISKEGRLESIPFTVKRDGYFEMISGHHRLRAARAANIKELLILADTRELDRSRVVAKQLAHNAIAGIDDHDVLKRLFAEIKRVDDILESYIDSKSLEVYKDEQIKLNEVILDLNSVIFTFAFLPSKFEKFKELAKQIPITSNVIGVCHKEIFEAFRDTLIKLGRTENIKNVGAMISRMVEITKAYIEETTKEKEKQV